MRQKNGQVIRRAKGRRARGNPHEPSAAGRKFCEVDKEEVNSTTQKWPARSATERRQRTNSLELAGTSSRRATCRPPSAARAESTAESARLHGAGSIEHLGADRRGPVRGADRAGARCSAACDCQNAFSSFCSEEKEKQKSRNTAPCAAAQGSASSSSFFVIVLRSGAEGLRSSSAGPVLETVLKCKLAIFSRK